MSDEHEDKDAVTTTSMSTFPDAGVVTIGKKSYAAGLIWTRVDDAKTITSTAKKNAATDGADLFLIRKSNNQFGLGSTEHGHKAGMSSLSDTLSKGIEGSAWTGIFDMGDDTYYFTAIQNSFILAGQDKIIHGREAALEVFSNIFLRGQWDHSFAPKDFNLGRLTEERTLEEVLGDTKPGPTLKPVSSKGLILKAAGALFVLGILFFGYQAYDAYQERVEQERIVEQKAAADEAKRKRELEAVTKPKVVVEVPPPPFMGKPSYAVTVKACTNAMKTAPTEIPGWTPVSVVCFGPGSSDEGTVVLSLKRDGGTINWISPFIDAKKYKIITTGQNGNISGIEIRWSIPNYASLPRYDAKSPTVSINEVRRHIISNGEESFTAQNAFRIADLPPQTVEIAPANGGTQPQVVPVTRGLSFSVQVRHDPEDLLQIISPLPVAVMNRVSLDLTGWNWIIEGSAYETLPLPPDAKPYQKNTGGAIPVRPAVK